MTPEPLKKEPTPHQQMIKVLEDLTGPTPDYKAQGGAISWLLKNYSVRECTEVLKEILKESKANGGWRGRVSWLNVKSEIGTRLAKFKRQEPQTQTIVQSEDSLTETEARELYETLPEGFDYHRRLLEQTFGLSRAGGGI